MPRVFAQTYNIAGGGQVPFFDFIGQGRNPERAASSSSLTGPPLEKENDDTDGSTNDEKACSSEGKWLIECGSHGARVKQNNNNNNNNNNKALVASS